MTAGERPVKLEGLDDLITALEGEIDVFGQQGSSVACGWIMLDSFTLPKFNIDPENRPSHAIPKGKDRIPTIPFQGRIVSFREGIHFWKQEQPS